ncbi:hypothetical protein GQ53DRAFT_840208 [Thozetella sp. PMI_491]|nr:hypothetical protein GQ53DRAFT_840208 [Thozetella sp. PMI_491]
MAGAGALRRPGNVASAQGYAGLVAGLIVIIAVSYWTRRLFYRLTRSNGTQSASPTWVRPILVLTRWARSILLRRVPGFVSGGQALTVGVYVAGNMILAFTNLLNYYTANNYASRFGWMITVNICVTVFLALKNTPLAFLTPYSYERINALHRAAGCLILVFTVAHTIAWLVAFAPSGSLRVFREEEQIYGALSGAAMLIMWLAWVILRRFSYELFYIAHVMFFIIAMITMALHRPDFAGQVVIAMIVACALWAVDRLIRTARFLIYSINNTATLAPLANGGTRVVLAKTPLGAAPGKHIFLWIPGLRAFQMHPFSIVSTHPTELVINSYDGFTKALHEKAKAEPGVVLKASMEGPYGTFPDLLEYDKIVLIAGGSGASFTFGLAVNALERMTAGSRQEIIFVWAVKEQDHLEWYTEHLNTILTHENAPKVKASVHITRGEIEKRSSWPKSNVASTASPSASASAEKIAPATASAKEKDEGQSEDHIPLSRTPSSVSSVLKPGRPNVEAEVRDAIESTPRNQRILVAACGPSALMKTVRNTTASCIKVDAPSIELHLEEFGW